MKPVPLHSRLFLEVVANTYRHTQAGRERKVILDPALAETIVFSDDRLLGRVIGNLIKNALEAVDPGGVVTIGCSPDSGEVSFWCHNAGVIPHEVQLQIFQRSFSTKEPDRGIGTYSVRLLTERYLKGRVSFISNAASGTVFTVTIPQDLRN